MTPCPENQKRGECKKKGAGDSLTSESPQHLCAVQAGIQQHQAFKSQNLRLAPTFIRSNLNTCED